MELLPRSKTAWPQPWRKTWPNKLLFKRKWLFYRDKQWWPLKLQMEGRGSDTNATFMDLLSCSCLWLPFIRRTLRQYSHCSPLVQFVDFNTISYMETWWSEFKRRPKDWSERNQKDFTCQKTTSLSAHRNTRKYATSQTNISRKLICQADMAISIKI